MNELGKTPADKNYQPSGVSIEERLCSACCPYYGRTPDQCGYTDRKMQWECPYFDFIQRGYEQAEKDLALTWEDIRKIVVIFSEVSFECFDTKSANEMCEETLTRFKQYKEAKQ